MTNPEAEAPAPAEEPPMEVHKPKPIHNWRELLIEIGVIVIGVCIALAGEQAVEALHNRGRAAEARLAIRGEIARNLGFMKMRAATEACMTARLQDVEGLIRATAAGILPQDTLWIGHPINPGMVDGKYRAATQSGALSLFDDKEQAAYATMYFQFALYMQYLQEEAHAWADLRTLENHPPVSTTLDWQLRSALQQARTARYYIVFNRLNVLQEAADLNITPAGVQYLKIPPVCVPLHTPREQALKMSAIPGYDLPIP